MRLIAKEKSDFFKNGFYSFINPFSFLMIKKGKVPIDFLSMYGLDGISGVWVCKIFSKIKPKRLSFDYSSVAGEFFDWCVKTQKRVALVGARDNEISESSKIIISRHPGLNLVHFRSGYFSSDSEKVKFVEELIGRDIDVVVVGMGGGLQEGFLRLFWERDWNGVGITCGGFFHQLCMRNNYYPKIFDYLNLRFLVRIYDEPYLIKRYVINYPVGIFLMAWSFCWDKWE